jgi:diguanylate cyclase (GGDEF)-like protein/PAS domain S-box-containing protein
MFLHCPTENTVRCVLFDTLFGTNSAPILLIDPDAEGAIVDANLKATEFYGYSREAFRALHVWDINTLGRGTLAVMREISSWSGGHYPQRFRHRLADGSTRDVQVYAGPIEVAGRRLLLCVIHDVTAVIEVEQFNRLLLESVNVGVCGIDPEGHFTFVNPEAVRAFGLEHESEVARFDIRRFLGPAGVPAGTGSHPIPDVAASGVPLHDVDCTLLRVDGTPFPARVVASPIRVGDRVDGVVVSFTDLTREREREDQIADITNSLPGVVFQAELSPAGVFTATYFNAAACGFFGLAEGTDLRSPDVLAALVNRNQWVGVLGSMRLAARSRELWEREFQIRGPNGGKWLLGRARMRTRANGAVVFNGVLLDITDRKRLEARLETAALTDPLTGLWNRRRFEQMLEATEARFAAGGSPYALIVIDIDHFKRLNDSFGHDAGDATLRAVADAIRRRSRQSDCLARWGGEEFAVLLPDTGLELAAALAEDVRRLVANSRLSDFAPITVSLGVGEVAPDEDAQALFRRVDAALYRAKDAGRNRTERA